jgi:hypothetical protein
MAEYPNISSENIASASIITECSEWKPPSRSDIRSSGTYESGASSASSPSSSSRLRRLFTARLTSRLVRYKSKLQLLSFFETASVV